MKKLLKAVIFMGILAEIAGLFGCKRAAKHMVGELTQIAVSQSDDTRYVTRFRLRLSESGNWLFNAEYYSPMYEEFLKTGDIEASLKEVAPLWMLLEEKNVIGRVEGYKKISTPWSTQVLDGGSQSINLAFSDGSAYTALICDGDVSAFFTELADSKYVPKAAHDVSQLTEISISCWGGELAESSYSYSVMKSGGKWLLNAGEINDREMSEDEINELFKIIEDNSLIAYAENYEDKPPLDENGEEIIVLDAENYKFTLKYSDNSEYCTKDEQQALVSFFDALIEKEEE